MELSTITHDEYRIYLTHPKCEKKFFTNYEPELLDLLNCLTWNYIGAKRKKLGAKHSLRANSERVFLSLKKLYVTLKMLLIVLITRY